MISRLKSKLRLHISIHVCMNKMRAGKEEIFSRMCRQKSFMTDLFCQGHGHNVLSSQPHPISTRHLYNYVHRMNLWAARHTSGWNLSAHNIFFFLFGLHI